MRTVLQTSLNRDQRKQTWALILVSLVYVISPYLDQSSSQHRHPESTRPDVVPGKTLSEKTPESLIDAVRKCQKVLQEFQRKEQPW